ncbi:MAG: toxin-antitoxin system YwqK family antitoxin [Bacteroidales bacterium]
MKCFFLLCFSVFGILAHVESQVEPQDQSVQKNFTDEDGNRQGYWESEYPDGNLRYRGTFRDNHPVGEFIRFFPNGKKMAVMDFCDQGIRAEATLFYENGTMAAEGLYIEEKKDSIWKYYSYYDNQLTSMETYALGIKQGLTGVYYPNGKFSETFWYEDDLRNGPWMQYYENGRVRLEAGFENDQRHGEFIFYLPSGRTEIKGQYHDNKMHGEWTYYDETGKVVSVINYVEGRAENEQELIEKEQEMFRRIEEMRGRIPEPDESGIFFPNGR